MTYTLENAVDRYIDRIANSYINYSPRVSSVRDEMIKNFVSKLKYKVGKKYIKIMTGHSVHSFVVIEDDQKFKAGDILKPAGWSTPTRNFSRGNVFNDEYSVVWMGA